MTQFTEEQSIKGLETQNIYSSNPQLDAMCHMLLRMTSDYNDDNVRKLPSDYIDIIKLIVGETDLPPLIKAVISDETDLEKVNFFYYLLYFHKDNQING